MNLTDQELDGLSELAQAATSGPWFVAVSTVPDTGLGEIVAAALIQQPRYIDVADERWGRERLLHRRGPAGGSAAHRGDSAAEGD
ncbi:hypothetical protein [Kutzneria sp. CA-103260]|uniref:hypothetical protein n=1 Tax=Kutzneria sp. CA-103260 TaxID=2802641 RepID=UPI001BAC79BE|nr:hypothetical protein [Kutzneria sp. CA-103260]QUQ65972.1 hypothetical protein JJ691_36970 [Kutzneria sp. CA-103260]